MNNNIKPITREEMYLNYLLNGGKNEDLPMPISKVEQYLYYLCLKEEENTNSGGNAGVTINVVDSLTSTSTTDALSANQGRLLNDKIPTKTITKMIEDNMNDGIGIRWSDGKYERISVRNIPTIAKSLRLIRIGNNGELTYTANNNNTVTIATPFICDIDLNSKDGNLNLTKGNNTVKTINLKSYIQSLIIGAEALNVDNFIHYYKIKDNEKIEITEDEFNNLQCEVKYFKELNGEMIEVTEEEFNKTESEESK